MLTLTLPVVPVAGPFTISEVAVALITVVATPLNLTVLFAGAELKLVPVMVTIVPAMPNTGLIKEIVGAAEETGFFLQLIADRKKIIADKNIIK